MRKGGREGKAEELKLGRDAKIHRWEDRRRGKLCRRVNGKMKIQGSRKMEEKTSSILNVRKLRPRKRSGN